MRGLTRCLISLTLFLAACQAVQPSPLPAGSNPKELYVLAAESFLADMAQAIAGDREKINTLIPTGVDPHSFEPTPQDVVKIANSQVLIINGSGYEVWLNKTLSNAGGERLVIQASTGLTFRTPQPGEINDQADPHFWLDPIHGIKYVEAIRDGLIQADPQGKEIYSKNAESYIARLNSLDQWISGQTASIPLARRQLVTNHESLGYFADRYGFTIVGAIIPSTSTEASPSAQQLAHLADQIRATNAPAVFLEIGANHQLADQLIHETGIKVIDNLYTETLSPPGGPAPDYITLLKMDTQLIVSALR